MKGWKVIKKYRTSACSVFGYFDHWTVKYPVGVEVKPNVKGSKLFFFPNRKDAEQFAFYPNIVVPCIAKGVSKPKYVCSLTYSFDNFWKFRSKCKLCIVGAPQGTRLADSITCLE